MRILDPFRRWADVTLSLSGVTGSGLELMRYAFDESRSRFNVQAFSTGLRSLSSGTVRRSPSAL